MLDRPSWVTPELLHRRLLESHSATEVLGDLFGRPVAIRRIACAVEELPPHHAARLDASPTEQLCHRRVTLLAAGLAVSEADLWYLPARLLPGMADTLRDTDTPFGIVVRPMAPRRALLAARFGKPGEPYALEHEAVLRDTAGRPIALVVERYRWPPWHTPK